MTHGRGGIPLQPTVVFRGGAGLYPPPAFLSCRTKQLVGGGVTPPLPRLRRGHREVLRRVTQHRGDLLVQIPAQSDGRGWNPPNGWRTSPSPTPLCPRMSSRAPRPADGGERGDLARGSQALGWMPTCSIFGLPRHAPPWRSSQWQFLGSWWERVQPLPYGGREGLLVV